MPQVQKTTLPEIELLAKHLALKIKGGEILALIGDLGSGKTTFTQHLAKNLRVRHNVTSPTFTVMNMFPAKTRSGKKITFYHLDLYRTGSAKEVTALGITEFWGKPGTVTVIEWADKIKKLLPKKTHYIHFL